MSLNQSPLSAQDLFLLEAWVAENPASRLFVRLGRAYMELGRPGDAAETLRRGLMVMPEETEARHLLALALNGLGDREGALEELMAAARGLAAHAGIFELMGELRAEQGRAEEAAWARGLARELALTPGREQSPAPSAGRPPARPAGPAAFSASGGGGGTDTATLAEIYAAQGLAGQAAAIYRRLLAQNPNNRALATRLAELESGAPSAPAPLPAGQAKKVLLRLEALRQAAQRGVRTGHA